MAKAILPKVWGEGAENFGASFQGAALGRRPGIIVSGLLRQARYWEILQAPRSDQELALPRAIATCGGVARLAEVCCSRVWLMAMDPVHSKMTKDDRAECCVTRG